MSKLEKVALNLARKKGRPLVLVFNNIHFFQHTDEGRNMLLLLQQRAEAWAESGALKVLQSSGAFVLIFLQFPGIMTCVFSS